MAAEIHGDIQEFKNQKRLGHIPTCGALPQRTVNGTEFGRLAGQQETPASACAYA